MVIASNSLPFFCLSLGLSNIKSLDSFFVHLVTHFGQVPILHNCCSFLDPIIKLFVCGEVCVVQAILILEVTSCQ